ncbi:MAG TPA: alpha/beta hydrolase [Actinomycetales bacterium]|nr:alpha/beta hydrolase [Actinomycetales bacterium]
MLRAVLITVAAVVVLGVTAVWGLQRRLVFFPDTTPVPAADTVLRGAEDVELTTADGLRLGAWYVPPATGSAPGATGTAGTAPPSAGWTVLFAPGNGGNRAGRAEVARRHADRGVAVLLMDYRGYGGNPGSPSEEGLALDVRAALDHLLADRHVDPDRLIYVGESLGCAVVSELATEHPPAALLLRSPFTALADVAGQHYPGVPARLLLRDRFEVRRNVSGLQIPVAVVYGDQDSIVPPEQSSRVAEAALRLVDLVVVRGADHNDAALVHGDAVIDAVMALAQPSMEGS